MPAVTFAITQLKRVARRDVRILDDSAWNDLREDLAARLNFTLAPSLRVLQSAANAAGCREKITLMEAITEFPVLLDAAARVISAWISAQHELLVRVRRDRNKIRTTFLKSGGQPRVCRIQPGLSDPHDGGRTATMLTFGPVGRVIYKPRPAEGEKIWFAALGWLNREGLSFRVPTILARKNYLWMEFLRNSECATANAVRLFYFRWGAQIAMAQLLGAIDLHRENWLAVGSQPVLVDAEFVGQPQPRTRRKRNPLNRHPIPALLETGLFPLTSRDRAGSYRGIAPFDSSSLERGPFTCWPRYQWVVQPPRKYVNDIVAGFDAVADIFAQPSSANSFFKEVIIRSGKSRTDRVLLRATAQYSRLLRDSLQPRNMISEGERWRALARQCSLSAVNRRVGLAEARALLRCDIPKFTQRRSSTVSWKRFSAAIAELKRSSRLLRGRVLLGVPARRA